MMALLLWQMGFECMWQRLEERYATMMSLSTSLQADYYSINRWACCLCRFIPLHQEADHKGSNNGDGDECKQDLLQSYATFLPFTDLRGLLFLTCHETPLKA
jgi:hypothetical protein